MVPYFSYAILFLGFIHNGAQQDPVQRLEGFTKITVAVESVHDRAQTGLLSLPSFRAMQEIQTAEPLFSYRNPQNEISRSRIPTYLHLYTLTFENEEVAKNSLENLRASSEVKWASPIYTYVGDPRDFTPNDPDFSKQPHHKIMESEAAWDITMGRAEIIVAVTDDGFEVPHPDLSKIWHANTNEEANGMDDDGNGLVDDITGWNFAEGTNKVYNPSKPTDGAHGTHVSGIVSAQIHNRVGVCGLAGNASVLPIKFYGGGSWTSEVIAKSYQYAADQGARIITTSYNVDGFVGDEVFKAGLEYAHQKGVLHFNSAGNNSQLNPARQKFEQLLLVCSTENSKDKISYFSNYGWGIDVCAPGSDILSTVPAKKYEPYSGTSMATPQAAGLAALIWSNHPEWNSAQVAAQLLGTADATIEANPTKGGLMGSGRINARKALQEKIAPPRIRSIVGLNLPFEYFNEGVSSIELQLDGVFALDVWSQPNAVELTGAGADQKFGTADDVVVNLQTTIAYRLGTNRVPFSMEPLKAGLYRLRGNASILVDPFGEKLDGNQDGVAGDDFTSVFEVKG